MTDGKKYGRLAFSAPLPHLQGYIWTIRHIIIAHAFRKGGVYAPKTLLRRHLYRDGRRATYRWSMTRRAGSWKTNLKMIIVAFSKALRRFAPPFHVTAWW